MRDFLQFSTSQQQPGYLLRSDNSVLVATAFFSEDVSEQSIETCITKRTENNSLDPFFYSSLCIYFKFIVNMMSSIYNISIYYMYCPHVPGQAGGGVILLLAAAWRCLALCTRLFAEPQRANGHDKCSNWTA